MSQEVSNSLPGKAPPGPRGLPIFGSLLSVRNDTHLAIHRLAKQFGDIFTLRLGGVPTVVISHPGLLKEAFDKTELSDRWVSQIAYILSEGKDLAMVPYGEQWRKLQRFANRDLLSSRNLRKVRWREIARLCGALDKFDGERLLHDALPSHPLRNENPSRLLQK